MDGLAGETDPFRLAAPGDPGVIARAIFHHRKRTAEHVTLLVYKDFLDAYEFFDDREADHDFLAGDRAFILEEWRKRIRQLLEDDFQRDNLMGDNEFQHFID
jgi:hypothetical protein